MASMPPQAHELCEELVINAPTKDGEVVNTVSVLRHALVGAALGLLKGLRASSEAVELK